MGCMEKESCPTIFLQNLLDWNIEDPKDKPIEKKRDIRDEIEQTVKELVASFKIRQISSFNVLSTFTLGLTGPNCSFR
jgi:arsenate reductase